MDRCEQAPNPFAAHRSSLAPYLENTWPKMQSLWQTRLTTLSSLSTPCESITSLLSAGLRVGPLGLDFSSVGTTADAKSLAATNATMAYYNAGCSECAIVIYIDWELRLASSAAAASLAGMNSQLALGDEWLAPAAARFRRDGFLKVQSWEGWGLDFASLRAQAWPEVKRLHALGAQSAKAHFSTARLQALEPLVRSRAVQRLASSYLGDRVAIDGYKIVHTGSLLTRATYPSGNWHNDGCGTRLKLFVYLDEVGATSGATRIAAGSQNNVYFLAGSSNSGVYWNDTFIERAYDVHSMVGKRGGGFIFDTNAAHRGDVDGKHEARDAIVIDMLSVRKASVLRRGKGKGRFSCPEKVRYALDVVGP